MISRGFAKQKKRRNNETFIRGLVASHSRGNASLNMGWYVTEDEMEERKKKILKRPFLKD